MRRYTVTLPDGTQAIKLTDNDTTLLYVSLLTYHLADFIDLAAKQEQLDDMTARGFFDKYFINEWHADRDEAMAASNCRKIMHITKCEIL